MLIGKKKKLQVITELCLIEIPLNFLRLKENKSLESDILCGDVSLIIGLY